LNIHITYDIAQNILLTMSRFTPGPVHVWFVVDKVALEHISYQVLQFCHVTVIPYTHSHSILIYSKSVCISVTENAL
jgi:hypothetical protein